MTADDRAAPNLSQLPHHSSFSLGEAQTAAFVIGELSVELTASPGAVRLVVNGSEWREVFVVDPTALEAWAGAIARLIELKAATTPTERAEYRSPFLIDREGRPSIAFEGLVGDDAVTYRVLALGPDAAVAGGEVPVETVRVISEAASGAVVVARTAPPAERVDG